MRTPRYHVLIIDDSPEDRGTYRRLLTRDGGGDYAVLEAGSVAEGLECLRTYRLDCVLLDYRLPGQNGLDMLNQLMSRQTLPDHAIVMLTGKGNEAVAVQAMKWGVQDYLVKGQIDGLALRQSIRNAVEKVALLHQVEHQRRELNRLATFDDLTELYNRRCFMERLTEEIARYRRYGSPLSVLLLDLDHFKRINDTHGHLVGDRVLRSVGRLLRTSLRITDLAARYGGEEFCVLAANTDLAVAETLGERLREAIAAQIQVVNDAVAFRVTCSIGAAEAGPEIQDGLELLARADAALYEAKHSGRNCVRRADPDRIAACRGPSKTGLPSS
jgi:diguanylate cyclase (GGDEF)-like protein